MGARQISTVMAAINVTERRQELTAIAEESVGAATVAQETWSNSLQAKLQELENAAAMFWQSFIDSESYHAFLETITQIINKMTELVDHFGAIPVTTAFVSLSLLTLNKNVRTTMTALTTGILNYVRAKNTQTVAETTGAAAITTSTGATVAKTVATNAATASTVGLTVATVALQSALTFGLSAVITAVVTGLTSMAMGMDETSQYAKELNQTLDEFNTKRKQNYSNTQLIKEYEKLNKELETLEKGTDDYIELEKELLSVKEQLEQSDSRFGYALEQTNKTLEERINLMELYAELIERENAEAADSQLADKKQRKNYSEQYSDAYNEFLRERHLYTNLLEIEDTYAEDAYKRALERGATEIEALEEKRKAQEDLNRWIADSEKKLEGDLAKVTEFMETMKKHNDQVDYSHDVLGYSNSDYYDDVTDKHINFVKEVFNLIETRKEEKKATEDSTDTIKENAEALETATEKQKRLNAAIREGKDNFVSHTQTLQELKDLLEDIETNGITLENFDNDLLADFVGNITDAAAVQEYLKQKIQETEEAQLVAYEEMVAHDEAFYQKQIVQTGALADYKENVEYQVRQTILQLKNKGLQEEANFLNRKWKMAEKDLNNAKTLAQARASIESKLINGMRQGYSEYYRMTIGELEGKLDYYYKNKDKLTGEQAKQYAQAATEMEAYLELYNTLFGTASKPIIIDVPTIDSGSGSSSSSSSSSEVDDLDLQINRYRDLEDAILDVENALRKNQLAQENTTNPTKKLKLMKEEIELYKKQQQAIKNLMKEQQKEATELRKKLSKYGFKFDSSTKDVLNYKSVLESLQKQANKLSGDAKKAKIEEVKNIKELIDTYDELINKTLPDTQNEYDELTQSIKEAYKEQLEFVADIQSQITTALEEELQKRYDTVRKALEKEQELYNKEYEEEQWEDDFNAEKQKLAEIQAQIDALSRDFSEAGRLKLEQLMEEYKEQQKVIDDMLNDKTHEDGNNRFDEALEELDKELEELLTPESLADMVSQALEKGFISLNGEVIKTENLLTEMLKNSGDLFLATGELIQTELIDGLKVAQSLMQNISSISSSYLSGRSIQVEPTSYSLTSAISSRSIDTSGIQATTPVVNVSFEQLLNVEGNLDTTLMLDLENKLQKAMNEVTHSISQALSYR